MTNYDKPLRLFLGAFWVLFGANGLMQIFTGGGFIPMPQPPEAMLNIMGGLFGAVYLMPLVKLVQLSSGILLLANRYTNLALVMLGPILVNIVLIHLVADLQGLVFVALATVIWAILFKNRWPQLKSIFTSKSLIASEINR